MIAVAPLTFGQVSVINGLRGLPAEHHPERNLTCRWDLPHRTTVTDVWDALRLLVERHESLRTRIHIDPGGASQTVVPAGELPVEQRLATGEPDQANQVRRELRTRSFDIDRQDGWCGMVFLDAHGAPRHIALCFHHATVDALAVDQLTRDFTALIGSESRARSCFLERPVLRPRELAIEQRSPDWQDRRRRSLEHWTRVLEEIGDRPPVDRTTGRVDIGLRSPTLRLALQAVAAQLRVSVQSVLLALAAMAVTVITGTRMPVLGIPVGNRFEPLWREIVSPMGQAMKLPVPIDPTGREFGDLVRTVHRRVLVSMRHGIFDPDEVAALRAGGGTPVPVADDLQYNQLPFQSTSSHAELPAERPVWLEPWYRVGPRLRLWVLTGSDLVLHWHADPRLLSEPALSAVLQWFRDELTGAAADPTIHIREMLGRLVL